MRYSNVYVTFWSDWGDSFSILRRLGQSSEPHDDLLAHNHFSRRQPSLLIIRFMLNLRQLGEAENAAASSDVDHFSRFSTPRFTFPSNLIGSIGEPLDFGATERQTVCTQGDDAETLMGSWSVKKTCAAGGEHPLRDARGSDSQESRSRTGAHSILHATSKSLLTNFSFRSSRHRPR